MIEEKIDNLIGKNSEEHQAIKDALRDKANKWVETSMKFLIGTLCGAVILFVLQKSMGG